MDAPRVYLSNDSYPELIDVPRRWATTVVWWRAIGHALRHGRFWVFVAVQVAGLVALIVSIAAIGELGLLPVAHEIWVTRLLVVGWVLLFAYLQASWGGDMMRSHLRAVSDKARYACPLCGHSLAGHLDRGGDAPVRCPECATVVGRDLFEPPYRVPDEFRAFPPWRQRPK